MRAEPRMWGHPVVTATGEGASLGNVEQWRCDTAGDATGHRSGWVRNTLTFLFMMSSFWLVRLELAVQEAWALESGGFSHVKGKTGIDGKADRPRMGTKARVFSSRMVLKIVVLLLL